MKKLILFVAFAMFATMGLFANDYGKGLEVYKLDNGLTVYLWPDASQSDVTGRVIAKVGSVDEPLDYTGLAHYLEHLLFKGNDKIGTLDWAKEKPLYDEIIALYDELAVTEDEDKRGELIVKINEKSMEAAKFGNTSDFSNLTESYGGVGLNAFTSYDLTCYFNSFPSGALEKWLELNSERLINPVLRSFQAELENVFEEYNMYQDYMGTHQRAFLSEHIYAGTPYERDIIGSPEHLKNPKLSEVIKFFNTWYVPNNMALVLVGNFDAATAKPLIAEKFGRLKYSELPERMAYTDTKFEENEKFKAKIGYSPTVMWVYKGIEKGHKDELALQFALSLLNNGRSTGLLDKLMLDGTISAAYAMIDSRRYAGRVMVQAVPYRDMQTGDWESNRVTERIVMDEVQKLIDGNIPEWLFQSVKDEMLQSYKVVFETMSSKMDMITISYVYEQPTTSFLEENKAIEAITIDDVKRVAAKYFVGNRYTMEFEEGDPKKNKLAKPNIKPLDPPKGVETAYAKEFVKIPTTKSVETFNDFADVKNVQLYDKVNLAYSNNTKNDVFSLTLRYGVGGEKLEKLPYAAALMNSAGMMPDLSAQDLRRKYSELGACYSFAADDSYFYISIYGDEKNLAEIVRLMSAQILMPNLDNKQIKAMISGAYWGRMSEKRIPSVVSSALLEWVLYGEKSKFIDRLDKDDLYKYSVAQDGTFTESFLINKENLTETLNEAKGYNVDMFYCGQKPVEEVAEILKAGPIGENLTQGEGPVLREHRTIEEPELFFLADSKAQQAKVYFFLNGNEYKIEDDVLYDAFNQYFSGGFSGLVMNEIREKRSMAYTAQAGLSTPSLAGKKAHMLGFVGTQNDKVADAIDVFMDLLTNMPDHPERMANIKSYLTETALMAKPGMRSKAEVFEYWQRLGYGDDPARVNMEKIKNLTYDDIKKFYEANIKGKNITIVIVGSKKEINRKQIEKKYGKMKTVSKNKLFEGGF